MPTAIPEEWKKKVRAILESGDEAKIQVTRRARQDWTELFIDAFIFDLYGAILNALDVSDLEGRKIDGMDETGDTYAFMFTYQKRQLYGKVNLRPDGKLVIIYSAHIPLKGSEL